MHLFFLKLTVFRQIELINDIQILAEFNDSV